MIDSKLTTLCILGSLKKITNDSLIIKQTKKTRFSINLKNDTIQVTFRKLRKTFVFSHDEWKIPYNNGQYDMFSYDDCKMLKDFTSWLLVNINRHETVKKCKVKKLSYKQLIQK